MASVSSVFSLGGALDSHRVACRKSSHRQQQNQTAGLEITFGGLRMRLGDRARRSHGAEVTSTFAPDQRRCPPATHACWTPATNSRSTNRRLVVARGSTISGGIDVPLVLGSRSTDLRAKFGGLNGRALRDGDELPLGSQSEFSRSLVDLLREQRVASWSSPAEWSAAPRRQKPVLRVIRGVDWAVFMK